MLKYTLFLLYLAFTPSLGLQPRDVLYKTELNFLQLMVDTRLQQRANPERSLDCFDYYLQLFDSINKEYKESYAACIDSANADRENIDASTQPERDAIEALAGSSCDALKVCAELSGSIDYFGCFADSGKKNTENMYEISANASENLANVRESYRIIENNEYRCTNASERTYAEQSYQANLALQSCLRGETPVPTVAPGDTTTDASEPSTTSEEPTTDDQESSTAPGDTTTDGPELSTTSEEPTTDDQESSTAPGDTTTDAPESSTTSDQPTTDDQVSSTAPGDTTTDAPELSTTSEEPTTDDQESSTAPGDTTIDEPGYEGLLPEEDLYVMEKNRIVKIIAALKKHWMQNSSISNE